MNVGGKDNIKRQVYDNLKCNFEGKEGNLSNKLHCCSSKLSQGMILKDMDKQHTKLPVVLGGSQVGWCKTT